MAENQFTTQSGWACAGMEAPLDIEIASSGVFYSPDLSLVTTSVYNFTIEDDGLTANLKGVYLLNASFTTTGAINDELAVCFSYEETSGSILTASVTYDSKGGNSWAVNQSVIIHTFESGVRFQMAFANNDSTSSITLDNLIFSAIKIY